jgi:hypothetical protein
MTKYIVNCSWEMFGHAEIEADSLADAIRKVKRDVPLSDIASDYVSESFEVDVDSTCDENSDKLPLCPICDMYYHEFPALSRVDNKTDICSACGLREGLMDYVKSLEGESE